MSIKLGLTIALGVSLPSVALAQGHGHITEPNRDLLAEDKRIFGLEIARRLDAVRSGYRVCIDGQLTAGESRFVGSESDAQLESPASRLARINHAVADCALGRDEQIDSMEPKVAQRAKLQLDAIDHWFRAQGNCEPEPQKQRQN